MAFATSPTQATTSVTTATTAPVLNLPTGIQAGDTLIMLYRCAQSGSFTWPAGWTQLFASGTDAADDQIECRYRKADGTEGATITLSVTGNGKGAGNCWRFTGAADPAVNPPEAAAVAIGTSTAPNPTTCTPTGGAKDYTWLALGGWDGEHSAPTYPTSHALYQLAADSGTAGAVTTNVQVAGGCRELNAASLDPGAFTITNSANWTASVIAIHPTTSTTITPGTGAATWAGLAPTVGLPRTVTPGTGAASWAGFAPTVNLPTTITPGTGAATWAGFAPAISSPTSLTPGTGQATWEGFAPSISVAGVNLLPGTGSATWAGFAPSITTPVTLTAGLGQATWAGFAPSYTIGGPVTITPGTGSATWAGFAPIPWSPTLLTIELRDGGVLRASRPIEPEINIGQSMRWESLLTPDEQALIPTWTTPQIWLVATGGTGVKVTRFEVQIPGDGSANIEAGTGNASWQGFAGVFSTGVNLEPGTGQAGWQGFAPNIDVGGNIFFPESAVSTWVASTIEFVPSAAAFPVTTATSAWVADQVTFSFGSAPASGVALQSIYAD